MSPGRISHRLKDNKQVELPSNLIFFDTETTERRIDDNTVVHDLKLGWAIHWHRDRRYENPKPKYLYFTDQVLLWDFVESKIRPKTRTYLIAHNVVFDFTVVKGFSTLIDRGWTVKSFYNEYGTVIIKLKKGTSTLIILDNLNFFRCKLAELGREVGLDKGEVDFATVTDEELSDYCLNDTEILYLSWKKYLSFIADNDLGNFSLTIPSQSFSAFRHRFMDNPIYIHTRQDVLALERSSYFGGRTECFFVGEVPSSPIYVLDVNSMYPFVMREQQYPFALLRSERSLTVKELLRALDEYLVVSEVLVKTDKALVPIRRDDKTIYPVGEFSTVLTTPEIRLVIDEAEILRVGRTSFYRRADIFVDYVDFFYDLKRKARTSGRKAEEMFTKLMMNSLYGKFGQRSTTWTLIGEADVDAIDVREVFTPGKREPALWYTFAGNIWEISRGGESFNSFPAISSHVTGYARVYLWKLIEQAGRENVYYCDTDSLFVNERGYKALRAFIDPDKLGSLALKQIAKSLTLYAPKDYKIDGALKQKGRRANAEVIDETTFRQEQWASFKTLFRQGDLDNYVVKKITKHMKREYTKGVVLPSGRVAPFLLSGP